MAVMCLKLVSGEELICDDTGNNRYSDIASIIMVPGQNGKQVGLGLAPFLPYSEDVTLTIPDTAIMIKFAPSNEMINNYNRLFGSGIQIASSIQ